MTRNKKKIIFTLLILTILYIIISLYASANFLKVTSYMYNDHTNEKVTGTDIKLVVIADPHDHEFGFNNQKLISKIVKQSPDLILLVGDFLNDDSPNSDVPCTLIRGLKDIAPVYFSLGNHELYIPFQVNHLHGNSEPVSRRMRATLTETEPMLFNANYQTTVC